MDLTTHSRIKKCNGSRCLIKIDHDCFYANVHSSHYKGSQHPLLPFSRNPGDNGTEAHHFHSVEIREIKVQKQTNDVFIFTGMYVTQSAIVLPTWRNRSSF
jgi:hypothetical protein